MAIVSVQIISKLLETKDHSILSENGLTKDYFVGYEKEIDFINEHFDHYGIVPDKATFFSKFPEFEPVEVQESDRYLVDTIREEYAYTIGVPVLQKSAELFKTDANEAVQYMIQAARAIPVSYQIGATDIVSQAEKRYDEFIERKTSEKEWYFTTGFPELDDEIYGLQRGEEFVFIFARINQGKSWVLEKIATHVWQLGYNVGYISPEMSATSIGYRFDTLYKNFSNAGLMWGKDDIKDDSYKDYVQQLKQRENKFMVATPADFARKITVSKLRNFVKEYKLDLLAVDGIKYLTDERSQRGDNLTMALTNISEDLMELSLELSIPIVVVGQANRSGVAQNEDSGAPELESARDSDGMAANASKVLSIRQKQDNVLEIAVKKNRFGRVGGRLLYHWSINTGEFTCIPSDGQRLRTERTVERKEKKKKEDVF